jgi:hypothetical protein
MERYRRIGKNFLPVDDILHSGITKEGFLWAIEHMDPGGSHLSSPGVPDLLTGARHLHPQRMTVDFKAPAGLAADETWDMCIITTPFPDMAMLAFKKLSADSWVDTDVRDVTWTLNDATANNSWWWIPEYLPSGAYPTVTSTHMRLISRGLTTELVGPEMYRSGYVTSGQLPCDGRLLPYSLGVTNFASQTGGVLWRLPQLANGAEALLELDPLCGQRPATLGDYNVLRMSTPQGSPSLRSTLEGGEACVITFDTTEYNALNIARSSHHHLWNDDFNMGVTFYMGLSSKEVLKAKLMGTVEISPRQGSSLVTLSRVVPRSDPVAIRLVADITSELPHSFPAADNDLGSIFGKIGQVLKNIGLPIIRTLGGAGIPMVSPIATGIGHIASAFGW